MPAVTRPCEASPQIRKAIRKATENLEGRLSGPERARRRIDRLRDLMERHPGDLFVHEVYQDTVVAWLENGPRLALDEYRLRLDARPDDPAALYLYGRLLVGRRTPEAESHLKRALAIEPALAPAHLSLVDAYLLPSSRNPEAAREGFKAYMDLCPESLLAYRHVDRLDDPVLVKEAVAKLRALVEGRRDPDSLVAYLTLWSLESRARPPSERAEGRRQVAKDLERLHRLGADKNLKMLPMLRTGHRMAGDDEGARRVEERILRDHAGSSQARWLLMERWEAEHPRPDEEAPVEQVRARQREKLRAISEWQLRWPDDHSLSWERMSIVKEPDDLPAQEVESAADAMLAAAEKERGTRGYSPPITIQVAELYVLRGLRLDRVPSLIERGLEEAETASLDEREWEWAPPGEVYRPGAGLRDAQWRAWPVLVEALLRTRQAERARATLDRMSTTLSEEKPGEGASNREKLEHASHEAAWWEWSGRLAEDEGRRLDALICYQNALAIRPPRGARARREPDRLAEGARRLWKELDGTDEGWLAFQNRLESAARAREATMASTWETKVQPLPDFDLPDVAGRVWSLADLKGKVSLINVWATWCPPCRDELPHLQKLHETLKDRPGVQVLTFNLDQEPGKVLPFLEKHKFTFPAIRASDYVWNVVPMGGIPRNWIVGPDGAMQAEQVGFEVDGEAWIRECLQLIERAAAPPPRDK